MSSPTDPSPSITVAQQRMEFNGTVAPKIAANLGLPPHIHGSAYSQRFAFFADNTRLALVAGEQEGDDVELALAHAIRHANGRALALVLPEGHTNATAQRVPWLRTRSRPTLYTHHHGAGIVKLPPRSRKDTLDALAEPRKGLSPRDELTKATAPAHLGKATTGVWPLVEWATTSPVLDHGHRGGQRSWHYAGQRVLSISRTTGGVSIVAGIHYTGTNKPVAILLKDGDTLEDTTLDTIKQSVTNAIEHRAKPGRKAIHRPDEHWLQAILRRSPHVVGVEQPALRELPAWRPHDSHMSWGRGFIDLLGLDGHGAIRIVETKLATNTDDLLVLQGLDYYVWATAYLDVLRARLSAAKSADLEIHYVLGAKPETNSIKISPCTPTLAAALDDDIAWRFQVVRDWFQQPDDKSAANAVVSERSTMPEK